MADKKSQKKELSQKQKFRKERKAAQMKKKLSLSVPVPEGLKKAWERENRAIAIRKKIRESKLAALPKKRQNQADRIKRYEQEYVQIKTDRQTNIINARKDGNFFKDTDPKIAIVIRIRGYVNILILSDSTKNYNKKQ